MTDNVLEQARMLLASLAVFRGILDDPAVAAFRDLLEAEALPVAARIDKYSVFVSRLLASGGNNWTGHLMKLLQRDVNPYVLLLAEGGEPSPALRRMVESELAALETVGRITSAKVAAEIGSPVPLAEWETSAPDYKSRYSEYLARIGELGYGVFAEHHSFLLDGNELLPVRNPDPVSFGDLAGYGREREKIIANTLALVEGRPAANTLLYGDSGTGKSTSVKAAANQFKDRGLRLIELRKDQLREIPALLDRLNENPLKFILFIDDLSFSRESDNYAALKGILEGSVSARHSNTVIYATSNRRHFIREQFSGRDGDDIHLRDTLEELTSLSDRFGLTLTFLRPDRELYFTIVRRYLERYKIALNDTVLCEKAESFALERGGRSARVARQFAESVAAQTQTTKEN